VLKHKLGRVQTDGEYKLLILLIYLSRTIECETIKDHMHRAGSHEVQISIGQDETRCAFAMSFPFCPTIPQLNNKLT